MKRYEATLVHSNDGLATLLAVMDGDYVLLDDVIELVEERMAGYQSASKRPGIPAQTVDKLRTCYIQMKGLLIDLRSVATPTRADMGADDAT